MNNGRFFHFGRCRLAHETWEILTAGFSMSHESHLGSLADMAVFFTSALGNIAEDMVTNVLPALRVICLAEDEDEEKYMYESEDDYKEQVELMQQFLSLRQLSGCPVTISCPSRLDPDSSEDDIDDI